MSLEFWARSQVYSEKHFKLMSELMAEAWMKATSNWQELHEGPLQIGLEQETATVDTPAENVVTSVFPANSIPIASAGAD